MKNKVISCIILILIVLCSFNPTSFGANTSNLPEDVLIRTNGYDIKRTTKIGDLKNKFGNPTIETDSPFGGKMYSFYNESKKYNLYAETNSNGELKIVGVISDDFKSHNYDALKYGKNGDFDYNYQGDYVEGYRIINEKREAVNVGVYVNNFDWQEKIQYTEKYLEKQSENLYNLQKHSIYVSKMLAYLDGEKFTQTYASEEIFYLNELLKQNKSTLYNTLSNSSKYNYVNSIGSRSFFESNSYLTLPVNPINLGGKTARYTPKGEDFKYFIYDIGNTKLDNGKYFTGYNYYAINPDFMIEKQKVELTQDEKAKLANVEKMFKEFQNYYDKSKNKAFVVNPEIETLNENQIYGKMNEDYLKAATAFLNMGRVGIGLNPVTYDANLSEDAQIKASTVVYLNNYGGQSVSHYFAKPDWMSKTDYDKCMIGAENLYMGGILGGNIFGSINYALNDGYGDSVTCGHRYNLIDPTSTTVGFGFASGQGCHKFTGYKASNQELVAWPSNGIMPMALIANGGIGNWTAKFVDGKHEFTDNTTVKIKNLNSGTEWNISNTKGTFFSKVSNTFLSFRENSVVYESDDVLEVTLTNVKYSNGTIKDYKYRIVFKSFSTDETINTTGITTESDNIQIELGKTKDLKVRIQPENASNKITTISSSNPSIATVRADGIITAKKVGKTTITIRCENIIKKVNVEVVEKIPVPISSIKIDKTNLNINEKETATLKVSINPTDTTDNKTVTWTSSNTKVATVDKNGKVTGVEEGTATITAKVGSKTATCKVTVSYNLPFKDVPKDSWYFDGVKFTYRNGMFKGYTNTQFAPFEKVTRGQLVTVLYRFEGEPDVSKISNKFTDVKSGEYFTNAVKWANSKGIVTGYGGTSKFGPGDSILRQDLALILQRYAKYKGVDSTSSTNLSQFTDYNTFKGNYAEKAVSWAVAKGVISGNILPNGKKKISPFDNATRAEVAVMLTRFIKSFNLK